MVLAPDALARGRGVRDRFRVRRLSAGAVVNGRGVPEQLRYLADRIRRGFDSAWSGIVRGELLELSRRRRAG